MGVFLVVVVLTQGRDVEALYDPTSIGCRPDSSFVTTTKVEAALPLSEDAA
jgi:hypothetical protein